jgi:hypothetical protein
LKKDCPQNARSFHAFRTLDEYQKKVWLTEPSFDEFHLGYVTLEGGLGFRAGLDSYNHSRNIVGSNFLDLIKNKTGPIHLQDADPIRFVTVDGTLTSLSTVVHFVGSFCHRAVKMSFNELFYVNNDGDSGFTEPLLSLDFMRRMGLVIGMEGFNLDGDFSTDGTPPLVAALQPEQDPPESSDPEAEALFATLKGDVTTMETKPVLAHPVSQSTLKALNDFCLWGMIRDICNAGEFDIEHRNQVAHLVLSFRDLFTEALRPGECFVGVSQPKDEPTGFGARARNFNPSPEKAIILDNFANTLVDAGVWEHYHPTFEESKYAVPAFTVQEHGKNRLVIDTSSTARNIVKIGTSAKSLEETVGGLEPNPVGYAQLDVTAAYHAHAYHPDTPTILRLVKCAGKYYRANRLLMGSLNSATFLNKALMEILGDLAWVRFYADDVLIQFRTKEEILPRLKIFFQRCRQYGVPLKASKANILTTKLIFLGRLLSTKGVSPDPTAQQIVRSLPTPLNGSDLAKSIGLANYARKTVWRMPELLAPLQSVMETVYAKAGSRRSAVVKSYKLIKYGWTIKHTELWEEIKSRMCQGLLSVHRDPEKHLHLFTDASNHSWGGLLTQAPEVDMTLPVLQRAHELVSIFGGMWDKTEKLYPTVELEALAILNCVLRGWHLIAGAIIAVFVDHLNLIHILDPDGPYIANRPQPGHGRLVRMAWKMREFPHTLEHLPGKDQERADLLSRLGFYPQNAFVDYYCKIDMDNEYGGGPPKPFGALVLPHAVRTVQDDLWLEPALIEVHELLTIPEKRAEYENDGKKSGAITKRNGLLYNKAGALLVPDSDNIRARILCVLHGCGFAHRSYDAAWILAKDVIYWRGMRKALETFCRTCIACLANLDRLPRRPWGRQIVAKSRNEVIMLDYLHMGKSVQGNEKILCCADRLTNYMTLTATTSENVQQAAGVLMRWIAAYGIPRVILVDRSPAFLNNVLANITERLGVDYRLTTARSHTGHAKQERIIKEVGRIVRRLMFESQMAIEQWESLVDTIQSVFNFSPTQANVNLSPIYCFTGLDAPNPIDAFMEIEGPWTFSPQTKNDFLAAVSDLSTSMQEREVYIHQAQEQSVYLRQLERNRMTGVEAPNFPPGTFVMVLNHQRRNKHEARWRGPYRVLGSIHDGMVVDLESVVCEKGKTPKKEQAHVSFVRFFDHPSFIVTPELRSMHEFLAKRVWNVEQLLNIRKVEDQWQLQVQWEDGERTWELLEELKISITDLVDRFLKNGYPPKAKALRDTYLREVRRAEGGVLGGSETHDQSRV